MKSKLTQAASLQARRLSQRISAEIRDYERNLGPIPLWFAELDPDVALRLMSACLRIGLRLPPEETLQADMMERAQAALEVNNQRTLKR